MFSLTHVTGAHTSVWMMPPCVQCKENAFVYGKLEPVAMSGANLVHFFFH